MEPTLFPEDIVLGKMKSGKMCLAVIDRTADMDSDEYDSDYDDDHGDKLEKGIVQVSWYPEGTQEQLEDSKLQLIDRSALPSDVVREKNGKQLGTVLDVEVLSTVAVVGTNKTLHVDAKSLVFINPFQSGDVVTLGSWVGTVGEVYVGITLQFSNGARGQLPLAAGCLESLESVYPHSSDQSPFVDDEDLFYPGQTLCGMSSAFKGIMWLDKSKTVQFKSKTRYKTTVEKVDFYGVKVLWEQCTFSNDSQSPLVGQNAKPNDVMLPLEAHSMLTDFILRTSPDENCIEVILAFNKQISPPQFLTGEMLRKLKRLQHFWVGNVHLGQRYQYKLTESDVKMLASQTRINKSEKKRTRKHYPARKGPRKQAKTAPGNATVRPRTRNNTENDGTSGESSEDNLLVNVNPATTPEGFDDIANSDDVSHLVEEPMIPNKTNILSEADASAENELKQSKEEEDYIYKFMSSWVARKGFTKDLERALKDVPADVIMEKLKELAQTFPGTAYINDETADTLKAVAKNSTPRKIDVKLINPAYGMVLAIDDCEPRDTMFALRHQCISSEVGAVQAGPKVEYSAGQYVTVEVCATSTKMDVEWQDGSEANGLPSVQVTQAHHIDSNDFCPGDFVLDERVVGRMYNYGLVLRADNSSRMANVQWFTLDPNNNDVQMLSTEEVSVYEIRDHPDYGFRISDVVSLFERCKEIDDSGSDLAEASGCVGQVVRVTKNGKLEVAWADASRSLVYPHEIVLRRGEGDEDSLLDDGEDDDAGSEFSADSGGSSGSWETTGSENEIANQSDTVTPSKPDVVTLVDEATSKLLEADDSNGDDVPSEGTSVDGEPSSTCTVTHADPFPTDLAIHCEDISAFENISFSSDSSPPSTHHYIAKRHEPANPRLFMKALQRDLGQLRQSLPEGIYVKTFEDRMDLLSVLFMGPKNTPYEDGIFAFDVQLPGDYPLSPPGFHYVSFSHRLNPNLYEDGKVCVSLLGTWSGKGNEKWTRESNLLQVLVSIQGLILNAEPYFNEAGYEGHRGTAEGAMNSRCYNEMVILRMVEHMNRVVVSPPAPFGELCESLLPELVQRLARRVTKLLERSGDHQQDASPEFDFPYPLLPLSKGVVLSLRQKLNIFNDTLLGIESRAKGKSK